jgi:hypothetical protein
MFEFGYKWYAIKGNARKYSPQMQGRSKPKKNDTICTGRSFKI